MVGEVARRHEIKRLAAGLDHDTARHEPRPSCEAGRNAGKCFRSRNCPAKTTCGLCRMPRAFHTPRASPRVAQSGQAHCCRDGAVLVGIDLAEQRLAVQAWYSARVNTAFEAPSIVGNAGARGPPARCARVPACRAHHIWRLRAEADPAAVARRYPSAHDRAAPCYRSALRLTGREACGWLSLLRRRKPDLGAAGHRSHRSGGIFVYSGRRPSAIRRSLTTHHHDDRACFLGAI